MRKDSIPAKWRRKAKTGFYSLTLAGAIGMVHFPFRWKVWGCTPPPTQEIELLWQN
jgi:hypothetical protein